MNRLFFPSAMDVFLELAQDGVSVFYSARLDNLGRDGAYDAAREEIGRFIEARRRAGEISPPYVVIVDFVVNRLQVVADEGLSAAGAKRFAAWAATEGLSGLAVSGAFRGGVFPAGK